MLPLSAGAAGPPDGEDGAVRRAAAHQPQRASRHAHPKPLEVAALTISDAVLCSEMGVHFSPCGRLLAACVACQVSALPRHPGRLTPSCGRSDHHTHSACHKSRPAAACVACQVSALTHQPGRPHPPIPDADAVWAHCLIMALKPGCWGSPVCLSVPPMMIAASEPVLGRTGIWPSTFYFGAP